MRLIAAAAVLAAAAACTTAAVPPQLQLAGTNWRIAAVNGQPTPAVGDFSMRFERGGRVGMRFGCNHMGGEYRLSSGLLVVSDVAQTLIGCPEPVATLELQGGQILGQPMRIARSTGGQVTLMNAGGSITLEPER